MIHFHCKWCGKRYRTEEKNAGRNNLCKRCGRPVWVPIPELRFACPRCGKRYRTEAQHAGLTLPCRDCGEPVTAPRRPDLSPEVLRRLPKGSELPKFFAIEAESQPPPAIDASPFELAPDPNLPPLAEVMVDFPDLSILQEAGLDLPLAQPAPPQPAQPVAEKSKPLEPVAPASPLSETEVLSPRKLDELARRAEVASPRAEIDQAPPAPVPSEPANVPVGIPMASPAPSTSPPQQAPPEPPAPAMPDPLPMAEPIFESPPEAVPAAPAEPTLTAPVPAHAVGNPEARHNVPAAPVVPVMSGCPRCGNASVQSIESRTRAGNLVMISSGAVGVTSLALTQNHWIFGLMALLCVGTAAWGSFLKGWVIVCQRCGYRIE